MIKMLDSLLQTILDLVNEAYSLSKEDRRKLNEVEWSSDDATPSILGESEIRADAITGIARRYMQGGIIDDKDETLEILKKYSVYHSPSLLNWLLGEGATTYRKYSLYLHNLEHLRLILTEMLATRCQRKRRGRI